MLEKLSEEVGGRTDCKAAKLRQWLASQLSDERDWKYDPKRVPHRVLKWTLDCGFDAQSPAIMPVVRSQSATQAGKPAGAPSAGGVQRTVQGTTLPTKPRTAKKPVATKDDNNCDQCDCFLCNLEFCGHDEKGKRRCICKFWKQLDPIKNHKRAVTTQLTLQAAFLQTALAVPPTAAGPIDVVDLFCEVGGFSEGARQAGHRVVLAVDSNKNALEPPFGGSRIGEPAER